MGDGGDEGEVGGDIGLGGGEDDGDFPGGNIPRGGGGGGLRSRNYYWWLRKVLWKRLREGHFRWFSNR